MGNLTGFAYCLKYSVLVFNFLFLLLGTTIFAVGIWIRVDSTLKDLVVNLGFEYYYTSSYIIIVAGAFMMLLAFLGCLGALNENHSLLTVYFLCLVVIFILEIAAAAYIFAVGMKGTSLDRFVSRTLQDAINQYSWNDKARSMLDIVQTNLYCCGVYNWKDYENSNKLIPNSCRHEVTGRQFEDGCLENVIEFVEEKSGIIGGLSMSIALLEILGMVFSICLICNLRKDSKV